MAQPPNTLRHQRGRYFMMGACHGRTPRLRGVSTSPACRYPSVDDYVKIRCKIHLILTPFRKFFAAVPQLVKNSGRFKESTSLCFPKVLF